MFCFWSFACAHKVFSFIAAAAAFWFRDEVTSCSVCRGFIRSGFGYMLDEYLAFVCEPTLLLGLQETVLVSTVNNRVQINELKYSCFQLVKFESDEEEKFIFSRVG